MMMTGSNYDSWGGVPMEFDIEEVDFLFEASGRIIEDRRVKRG